MSENCLHFRNAEKNSMSKFGIFINWGRIHVAIQVAQWYRIRPPMQEIVVQNPPTNAGDARDAVSTPGWGRSLGEEMATHTSILAWKIP